jgi:hypothetical protein
MTRAKRAWCKANFYVRSGQHEKAIFWLSRTVTILDGKPPKPHRLEGLDMSYMVGAVVIMLAIWIAAW